MYNTALRITQSQDDAEDVLQESFLNAFRRLETYSESATFGAWLKRIVVNRSIDCVKRRRIDWVPLSEMGEDFDQVFENEVEHAEIAWQVKQVQSALRQLPDGYRIVFSLYLLEGYDHEEISQLLGISVSTSKSQLNRSKKKVRELLNEVICHGKEE